MQVNGTLINYYFHCKRQCYLHGNRLNLEDNSEQVKIGKAIHEEKSADKSNSEIAIDNIRLDKLTKEYLTEVKKSDADVEAAKWQLLYYLKVLKNKGVVRMICTQNPGHIDYCSGSTHGCYPIFNGRHPFCFCLNSFIIVVFYVFFNSY